jgi:Na+/proline symporter
MKFEEQESMILAFGNLKVDGTVVVLTALLALWWWKRTRDRLAISAIILCMLCGAQFAVFCLKYKGSPLVVLSGVTFAMSGFAAFGRLILMRSSGAGGQAPRRE